MVTTRTIEQTVTFRANPHDVSEALTDSEQRSQFTEAQAPKMKGFLESWVGRRELANNFTAEFIFRWSRCSQL